MISSLAWVKKGAAQEVPTRYTNEDAPERLANQSPRPDHLISSTGRTISLSLRFTHPSSLCSENPVDEVSDESMDEDLAAEAANNVAMDAESAAVIKKYNLDDYDNEDGASLSPH